MSDGIIPAEAFPVGQYLQDELRERGWSTGDCAKRMGGNAAVNELALDLHIAAIDAPPDHVICDGTMGRRTAEGLARAFGTNAETWLNLDRMYHEWRATRKSQGPTP